MTRRPSLRAQSGFTLMEAIIVIVLLGVLGGIVAVFIRLPIQGYTDSVARAEITDQADLALRRMTRDLRLALPNSIRVSNGNAVEFLLTKAGGRYFSVEDQALEETPSGAQPLDFMEPAHTTFTVVAPMPSFAASVGDLVVVYNLGEGMAPADAYQLTNAAPIDSISADHTSITLHNNPFAVQDPPMPSPSQRFQVVSGPVTYYCAAQEDGSLALWRLWGYKITPAQTVPPAGARKALLATGLANCNIFDYGRPGTDTQRSALVILTLELKARNGADPAIRLVHQVHVDNTP